MPPSTKIQVVEEVGSPLPAEMTAVLKEKQLVGKDVTMKDLYVLSEEEEDEVRNI